MGDEAVQLLEGAFVQEKVDALAGGELAAGMLGVDAALPAAEAGLLFEGTKVGKADSVDIDVVVSLSRGLGPAVS